MLIKKESESVKEACLNYEEGELKIDLDYNNYLTVAIKEEDEPLDLSDKKPSLISPILPTLVIKLI